MYLKLLWSPICLLLFTSSITFAAEVYFSPSSDCENKIVEAIVNAKKEIEVAVYSINNRKIVDALEVAHRKGVSVRILTDSLQAAGKSSRVLDLTDSGIDLRVHSVRKIMHNKFAIFDNVQAVSGSFNWTKAASSQNSENCILFTEANVLKAYQQEFARLWDLNAADKSKKKLEKIKQHRSERVPAGE